MSKMDDNHRYHPYYRTKNYNNDRRYNDDYKHQYKKTNKHHYPHSSSRRDNRNYNNDYSYRRPYRNDYHYQQSRSYSSFSTPPPPLMSTPVPPCSPPLLPPAPPALLTVVPHERESWIRSVKKTKMNESTEQKTQYLETMLRMPQQKSLLNSSRFDRMRFADDQSLTTTNTSNPTNNDNFDNSSFHLVGDVNAHDDIRTLEKILFDNEVKQQQKTPDKCSNHQSLPTPPPPIIEWESSVQKRPSLVPGSGFLIDNCDEEELPPLSPPPRPLLAPPPPSSSDELIQQNDEDNNERRVMLVSELDAADAERRQELKHQKRLHKKLLKKKKEPKIETQQTTSIITNDEQELLSDWIIEYDTNKTNQVSELTDEVRRTSVTMTNEDKTAKVNLILMKIKKQQDELKKLRQYVMSMLGEQHKQTTSSSSKTNRPNSNLTHDLLMAFLNQSTKSECWLCSGKMYAEVATQCDHIDE